MTECPPEQFCYCWGLSALDCLRKVPIDRYPELFSLAMGGIALVGLLIIIPMVLYASRPNSR